MLPFWKRKPRYAFPVNRIHGTRAMINGNGGPERIDLNMEIDGDNVTVELTVDQARGLILDLSAAYDALRPPLRGRAGWGA